MANSKYYQTTATHIKYYGEGRLKWYQRPFFNPPRTMKGSIRTSRRKAEDSLDIVHRQFGLTFTVLSHTEITRRIR